MQGLRNPKNRSLLSVSEDFEGKRNAAVHFLFNSLYYANSSMINCAQIIRKNMVSG